MRSVRALSTRFRRLSSSTKVNKILLQELDRRDVLLDSRQSCVRVLVSIIIGKQRSKYTTIVRLPCCKSLCCCCLAYFREDLDVSAGEGCPPGSGWARVFTMSADLSRSSHITKGSISNTRSLLIQSSPLRCACFRSESEGVFFFLPINNRELVPIANRIDLKSIYRLPLDMS